MMITGLWRSLVARLNGVQEAPGSSPGSPTRKIKASEIRRPFVFAPNITFLLLFQHPEKDGFGKRRTPAHRESNKASGADNPSGMVGQGRSKR